MRRRSTGCATNAPIPVTMTAASPRSTHVAPAARTVALTQSGAVASASTNTAPIDTTATASHCDSSTGHAVDRATSASPHPMLHAPITPSTAADVSSSRGGAGHPRRPSIASNTNARDVASTADHDPTDIRG